MKEWKIMNNKNRKSDHYELDSLNFEYTNNNDNFKTV